ncbi:MAG: 50S ribosomal protein L23 [Planctomycetes bacterium]|nr:50S ribosomal protein L23 [Planctomycetota bacterium]
MKKTPYDVIIKPLMTEKSTKSKEKQNAYIFAVNLDSNKPEIKEAIEKAFTVKVDKVRTMVMKGKPKRYKFKKAYLQTWKKAVVTLKEGSRIDIL